MPAAGTILATASLVGVPHHNAFGNSGRTKVSRTVWSTGEPEAHDGLLLQRSPAPAPKAKPMSATATLIHQPQMPAEGLPQVQQPLLEQAQHNAGPMQPRLVQRRRQASSRVAVKIQRE